MIGPNPYRSFIQRIKGVRQLPWFNAFMVLLVFHLVWELLVDLNFMEAFLFPPPSKIVRGFYELSTSGFPEGVKLLTHVQITLARIFKAYGIACFAAILLGILIGWYGWLYALCRPVITFCRSIPAITLIPLMITWFGIGELSKVFLIGYVCFWVTITNTIDGVRYVDPVLIRAAKSLDANTRQIFYSVVLPAISPRITTGLRMSLSAAFMVIIAAELIATVHGLGALIMEARRFFRADLTMVGMIVIGLCGMGLNGVFSWIERRVMVWHIGLEQVKR
jgi:ABC-type nitrate/sulfonate/bicarbonate transport system permease component